MPDHVHLLLDINPKYSVVSVVAKIKGWTFFVLGKRVLKVSKSSVSLDSFRVHFFGWSSNTRSCQAIH